MSARAGLLVGVPVDAASPFPAAFASAVHNISLLSRLYRSSNEIGKAKEYGRRGERGSIDDAKIFPAHSSVCLRLYKVRRQVVRNTL